MLLGIVSQLKLETGYGKVADIEVIGMASCSWRHACR